MKLSIVIPAHNEEHRLPAMLESYAVFFSGKYGDQVELIVVPNNCKDQTSDLAKEMALRYPQIKVLDDPGRVGKGGAVIRGVKTADGEWIGFVDADGATAPEEFDRLVHVAHSSDGVIGSRWMKKSKVNVRQTGMRLLSSRLFNGLIRLLLGLKYVDTQCGAKIFQADAWRVILPNIGITRFAFDVDVLFQLKRSGFSVIEEPTVWSDVEGSTVHFFNSSFDMFCAVVRMRLIYSPFRFIVPVYERFFSRIVEFLRRDQLISHAMMLFAASMIGHVCNVCYQMVVSRALSPKEYALLVTFLSLFAILMRPLGTLATATNHYASLLMQEGRPGSVKRLIKKWMLIAGIPSLIAALISVLCARHIALLFGLERIAPVVVFSLSLPVLFLAPVVNGALRGMQQFGLSAAASVVGTISRLIVGATLVFLVFPACGWALAGHASGLYLNLLLSIVVLIALIRQFPSNHDRLPSFRLYLAQCFFIQFSMGMLMNSDVVFVRHFIPEDADFAKAATLGRMVVFLTGAISASMFPKVSSTGRFTQHHRKIYLRGLSYASLFVLGSLLFCFLFPRPLLRIIFHVAEPTAQLVMQTGWMSLVMSFAVLLAINISLLLAQRKFKVASVAVVCAALYFLGVQVFHASAYAIIAVAGLANALGVAVTTSFVLRQKTEEN